MSRNIAQTARTLLMVTVMIASALMPMVPEAAELRDNANAMRTAVTTDANALVIDEGDWGMYEVTLDHAPQGVLVVTPSSDNAAVTVDPAYLKFTKVNWDTPQYVYVDVDGEDDDGADTTATISHTLGGTDTNFVGAAVADVSISGVDHDTDTDGDGLHDGIDDDDDDDGVDDANEEAGCELVEDCDGDGVNDDTDAFPLDNTEDTDSDGDGTGDNADDFPSDDTEATDSDGDGIGDNSDDFPSDANETTDTDGDGIGDNSDDFPSDENETTDTDGDGTGDNSDDFPSDENETTDTDGDGTGDNSDDYPSDENETTDTDGDGIGDNSDDFPSDDTEDTDSDGDGTGDNADDFPSDANETTDTDGDGTGDNADTDDDGDGVDDSNEESGCDLDADCDGDGVNDSADDFPLDANATTDTDGDGDADMISVSGAVYDIDFEGGTLPTYVSWELSQCTGQDSSCVAGTSAGDWTVSDDRPIDGTYSLLSGALSTYYENTNISVTFTSAAGAMTFDYQISSLCRDYVSTYYDGFRLYVDGVQVNNPSDGGTACENGVWGGAGATTTNTAHPAYSATHFMCADGTAGFSITLVSWIGDNYNDCSDGSDEDTSYTDGLFITPPVSGSHSQDLAAGTHTVLFQFHGGTSGAAGDSIAWIDNLVIPVAAGTLGSVGPTTTTDGTSIDNDDDDDGYPDVDETTNCVGGLSDPLNSSDVPANDNDADYLCDAVDDDDDNDGVLDADEADGSGLTTATDCTLVTDCDLDNVDDATDAFPVDPSETSDMDDDGIGDNSDDDRDGDGYLNTNDAFPDDDTEWGDNDGDGTGDNADTDDDTCPSASPCGTFTGAGSPTYDYHPGDQVLDVDDLFPLSPAESADNDGDGWGDNADYDDDNDGIGDNSDVDMDGDGFDNDDEDTNCVGGLSDPQNGSDTPADMDGDGTCDALDIDTDGDGTNNTDQGDGAADAFDDDACADTDTDGDGMPDTIIAGCTTTLTEDDDDDAAAAHASHPDSTECGMSYYQYVAYTCTYTLLAGDSIEIELLSYYTTMYQSGSITGPSGTIASWGSYSSASAVTGTYGPFTTAGDYTVTHGSDPGYYTLYSSMEVSHLVVPDWTDAEEATCGTDPADSSDEPTDTDGDGLCDDIQDDDNDGDGWSNADEETNCAESNDAEDSSDEPTDTDDDDVCNELDDDDDGDTYDDANDAFPLDDTEWLDTDGDTVGDNADTDDDGDGTADTSDAFTLDACADTDTDGDGSPDSIVAGCTTTLTADDDDDDDDYSDADETTCGSATDDDTSLPTDTDSDLECDGVDDDDDGDGVLDVDEADGSGLTPATDCTLVDDCDSDGVLDADEATGCTLLTDCDGDNVDDATDAFPLDASETLDTDGDGTGNNADTDDDGDGYSDADETTNCGDGTTTTAYSSSSDPLNISDTPDDMDGDGTCDYLDGDRDGDFIGNAFDGCPDDASGYTDTDDDGACDESDTDDDDDTYDDANDAFPLDGSEWLDTDGDGIGNNGDADDDGDGTDDQGDECPLDDTGITDFDGDGVCDVTDTDDDDDGVLDTHEDPGCDMLADCDGDGVGDATDVFDWDSDATTDTDGDWLADDFLDSNTATSTTWNISTQSNNALTIYVYDENGVELCELVTNAGGQTAAGTDTANATAFCQATAGQITIEAEGTDYYTYYGAVFGNWAPNVVVQVADDSSVTTSYYAQYQWYYDNFYGNAYEIDFFNTQNTQGTGLDFDDDGDGYSDSHEDIDCVGDSGDSLDDTTTPDDNDADGLCDYLDDDDDDDGYSDSHESNDCGTDPMTAGDVVDFDGDGVCDLVDDDDDGDGTDDTDDWQPYNAAESADTDNDGVGDNEDDDADGDGTLDSDDVSITDRCSSVDTDGDGLTDDYDDCSSLGFHTTVDAGEGANAGAGFGDGGALGITDDASIFGYSDGQYFVVSDTDGVFRWYADGADDVAAISMDFAMASTDWEPEDWYRAYWVDDNGTTTEIFNSSEAPGGDIDNIGLEGWWFSWSTEIPGDGSGHFLGMISTDDPAETFGFDNFAYWDDDGELIAIAHMEDSVENLGGWYQAPSDPVLGTYTIDLYDSFGDGGHIATATMNGATLCTIGNHQWTGSYWTCTFDVEGLTSDSLEIDVDTDSYPGEGSMTVTFPDGSTTTEYWGADTTFSYAHTGAVQLDLWGDYTIQVWDSFGDGGHAADVSVDGTVVCSVANDYGYTATPCTWTSTDFTTATLEVAVDTDNWGYEGSFDITLPDGSVISESSFPGDTTYTYTLTPTVPAAGEVELSNGWGATVSIDTSAYYSGTVDDDDDNDGVLDEDDAFPLDDGEWDDLDGDGLGSNDDDNDDDGDGTPDNQDDFPRHAHADTDTDGDGMPDEIHWTDGDVMDDFSAGNLTGMDWTIPESANNTGWEFTGTTSGSAWYVTSSFGEGARSGPSFDHSDTGTLSITLETVEGIVAFDYMISSEERYDTLSFSIDGMEYMQDSGLDYEWDYECEAVGSYGDDVIPGNWVNDGVDDCGDSDSNGVADDEEESSWYSTIEGEFEAWISEGEHTFSWTFSKDGDTDVGYDMAFIDDVVFPYWVIGDWGECSDGTDDCNIEDMDDDGDGLDDLSDDCPTDAGEAIDTDGDGVCDNQDTDDDNDGVYDYNDAMPLDPNEQFDADGDGIGDNADDDDDNDGCTDDMDDMPYDDSDCVDTDGDGVGDTADPDDDGDNVMDAVDPFPLDGDAWLDTDGDGEADYTGDPPFLGNFEGGSIPAGWTTYGDAPWHVCGMGSCLNPTGNPINGSYMGENGDINDAQTSSLEVTMDTLSGSYSFDYETSTEGGWDYLRFYVDGSLTMSWSGINAGTYSGTVSAGYHTFQWMYYKDSSISANADSVWVDDIILPISQTMINNDPDDDNDGVYDEMDFDPLDPCVSLDTDGDGRPDTVLTGQIDMNGDGWIMPAHWDDTNNNSILGDTVWVGNTSHGSLVSDTWVDVDGMPWYDDVDCSQTPYSEDWDDDGDGWSDMDEWICGSNDLDANERPSDVDNDWICDAVDDDLDNDGYINPIDCEIHLDGADLGEFLDCLVDNFNGADSSDDGEVDAAELAVYFGVGGGGDGISYICGDGSEVPFEWVNDGIDDCPLGADEQQYDADGNKTNWFDCFDGSEIWMDQVNDGVEDCLEGEDEHHEDEYGSGISEEEFNATWDYLLMFDADNSSTLNFDEYWELNNCDMPGCAVGYLDELGLTNPGWGGEDTEWDAFPLDPSEHVDSDGDGIGDNADNDDDNDGVSDTLDAFPYDPTESEDLDGDGIGDNSDNDTDGDGIDNEFDQFDQDPNAASDSDDDGVDDGIDNDDDNDGVPDVSDWAPTDPNEQYDTDEDGIGDNADTDDDNDGVLDADDAFDLDPSESADYDGDGVGDNADPDDDNDGIVDGLDAFPNDSTESRDTDGDTVGDNADADDDGDGVADSSDRWPLNPAEDTDTDGDNIGDNSDADVDGDDVANDDDWAPMDSSEWADTDNDGIGDNADDDDDGDGYTDSEEYSCGTDEKNPNSVPSDYDGDGECDATDLTPVGDRSSAADGQEAPGFTPGFPAVLAAISLLGAAVLGRRKDD